MGAHLVDSVLYGHLWSTPEIHRLLDDQGRPTVVAGVPPDFFSVSAGNMAG